MRALKIFAGLLVVLAGTVALFATAGLPTRLVAAAIGPPIERATGWRVALDGPVRLGLWPLRLTLHDVAAEAPAAVAGSRLTLAAVTATLDTPSFFAGRPRLATLALERPELRLPLHRERSAAAAPADPTPAGIGLPLGSLTVRDGSVILTDPADGFEDRVTGITLRAVRAQDRVTVHGTMEAGGGTLAFDVAAALSGDDGPRAGRSLPVTIRLDAPHLLRDTLNASAEVRRAGRTLRFNAVSGALGKAPFNGWAAVELAGKPLVKLDIDFQKLAIRTPAGGADPWSTQPLDLRGLRYLDAQLTVSAAELDAGTLQLRPAALRAGLAGAVANVTVANAGLYDGHGSCEVTLDAAGATPTLTLRADLEGVRAEPLLAAMAGFDALDATMRARIAVQGGGATPHAILASLDGTAFFDFRNGTIRNVNVARMIRSLTAQTLSGWQEDRAAATDLSQLAASFRIAAGEAATSDLTLAGPLVRMTGAGRIDLAARTLAMRVEPRLVLSLEGQGGAPDPLGFGVPVRIDGPWHGPRIYPDVAGILDNPDAAYARLRALGQGLFGTAGQNGGNDTAGSRLGTALDGLLQSLGPSRSVSPPAADAPDAPAQADDNAAMDAIIDRIFGR